MAREQVRSPFNGAERFADPGVIDEARLAWRLLRDPRVSWLKLVIPVFAALYVVSPIDPIPDFLLGIGQVDDLGVLVALAIATMRLLPRLAPGYVVSEHRADMHGRGGSHRNRYVSESDGPIYDGAYSVREGDGFETRQRGNA